MTRIDAKDGSEGQKNSGRGSKLKDSSGQKHFCLSPQTFSPHASAVWDFSFFLCKNSGMEKTNHGERSIDRALPQEFPSACPVGSQSRTSLCLCLGIPRTALPLREYLQLDTIAIHLDDRRCDRVAMGERVGLHVAPCQDLSGI